MCRDEVVLCDSGGDDDCDDWRDWNVEWNKKSGVARKVKKD
jgi:hypothetical protein